MTYGIAAYKVTPKFCSDEVDFITSLGGIEIKYNHELGQNISLEQLQQQYDAVFLGIGVGLANPLNIPGEDLGGVENAIDFIYNIRDKGYPNVPVGDKVVVIGMGMTAIDAATQAKRLGAKEVTMVYRRTEAEKACTQAELDIAMLDGCKIVWLAAPKEIIGENGKVNALICDVMTLGAPDHTGKPAPIRTGETITLETDMVIKATGQMPFEELVSYYGIDNRKGKILSKENHSTSLSKIFAGGDCVNGGKEVVDAVQAGKEAAASIISYLQNNQV
jgi:glutamate synthase (NADPH/NADH) small chain